MKVGICLGTRPEIIKLSPVIRLLQNRKLDFVLIHSGQHYSDEMDSIFFKELNIPKPKYNLNVGSCTHSSQTSKILKRIEPILVSENLDILLVQGDTNTVMASALAAVKIGIKVGHIEAGLRSFDRNMPEEINRVVTDHISDFLFCPTKTSAENLYNEGISKDKIFITGNTIVDSLSYSREKILNSKISDNLNVKSKEYFLATIHRQENVDNKIVLSQILTIFNHICETYKCPVIFPIHPRTRKMISNFKISTQGIELINPVGYHDFLSLQEHSSLIFTDSGGVQEEACIIGTPCITIRNNTERPETVDVGSNFIAGINSKKIFRFTEKFLQEKRFWKQPFGDGTTAKEILDILTSKL